MRNPGLALALALALPVVSLAGCPAGGDPPSFYCPGSPGCEDGYKKSDDFVAGAAAVAVTPTAFELPRLEYLERSAAEGRCDVGERCGELLEVAFRDCGTDMLCRGDDGYVAPDADGTEKDGLWDFFDDCGTDNVCPGDAGYTAPDADGTEGNGIFDGIWMAGFGNNLPAVGVHDDVWARTVVVGRGDTKVSLTYIDAVGIFNNHVDDIRDAVERLRPDVFADLDFIFVGATHVHESADTMGQWGPAMPPDKVPGLGLPDEYKSGVSSTWFPEMIEKSAQSIIDAWEDARPAHARFASGRTGAEGVVRDSRDPNIIDDTISVMELYDAASGDTISTVVNWGNHPEVLSDTNNFISSDYSHYLREAVENGLPAEGSAPAVEGRGGICVYMQGPVGGLLTPLGDIGARTRDGTERTARDYEKTRAVGERVAEVALEILADAEEVETPGLAFGSEKLLLPMNNIFFQVIFGIGVFDRDAFEADGQPWQGGLIDPDTHFPWLETEVFRLEVGPASFLSVPGEVFSEACVGTGAEWTPAGQERFDPNNPNPPDLSAAPAEGYRDRMTGNYTFILGLGLDEIGYLVPEYQFELDPTSPYYEEAAGDHYEETNSLGPSTVPTLDGYLDTLLAWEPKL